MTPPRQIAASGEQYSLFDTTVPLRNEEHAHALPKTARLLVDVIGLDATIDLVKVFGGDEIAVPNVVDGKSRMWAILVESVGAAAAAKMVDMLGRTVIYVPKCEKALRALQHREIRKRYDKGESFDALRRELNVSRSWLFRLLKQGD